MSTTLEHLRQLIPGRLIASCQPVLGGPFDSPAMVCAFADAARIAGASALRVQGVDNLRAVREAQRLPIIGLIKRDIPGYPVYITPEVPDIEAIARCQADIIAFDATRQPRPVAVANMIEAVHQAGKLVMADISTEQEGLEAYQLGADLVATTLSGYTPYTAERSGPDLELVARLAQQGIPVVAEGRMYTPQQAQQAVEAGAFAVVVGTAFSRPEVIVEWFVKAVS